MLLYHNAVTFILTPHFIRAYNLFGKRTTTTKKKGRNENIQAYLENGCFDDVRREEISAKYKRSNAN